MRVYGINFSDWSRGGQDTILPHLKKGVKMVPINDFSLKVNPLEFYSSSSSTNFKNTIQRSSKEKI
jgi:hypothetical protein